MPGTDWEVSRFYEIAWLRDRWFALMSAMKGRGIDLPWDFGEQLETVPANELNASNAAAAKQVEEAVESGESDAFEFGRSEEEVTTRVDVSGYLDAKRRSMDCHKTQRQDLGWMLELPEDLADSAIDLESFVLRWRDQADVPATLRETWLLP